MKELKEIYTCDSCGLKTEKEMMQYEYFFEHDENQKTRTIQFVFFDENSNFLNVPKNIRHMCNDCGTKFQEIIRNIKH